MEDSGHRRSPRALTLKCPRKPETTLEAPLIDRGIAIMRLTPEPY